MDSVLQTFHEDLKALRRALKSETNPRVAKKSLRQDAEQLGRQWFKNIEPELQRRRSFPAETLKRYATSCERLIKLSAPNNLCTS
ncbi:MAG: hypothetical protein ACREBU_16530, partial [Nitrososphaera sp.]